MSEDLPPMSHLREVLSFVTGGTTSLPKLVSYSLERFAKVVDVKARMLGFCGVGPNNRVMVLHPMAPWSIGNIHVEGALRCGASVLPAGISLSKRTIGHLIREFRPDILCGGARNLARIVGELDPEILEIMVGDIKSVFTAGEKLAAEVRAKIEFQLQCSVRDFYGCAELDGLGVEGPEGAGLHLVPDYVYRLRHEEETRPLLAGTRGLLEVQREAGSPWHATGDIVEVLSSSAPPWGTAKISVIGRSILNVSFADGSSLTSTHLSFVKTELMLTDIQLVVFRHDERDVIEVLFVKDSLSTASQIDVVNKILESNIDFEDAVQAGCILDLSAREVESSEFFYQTERQKAPMLFVKETGQ